jgi:hypothetical protein
MFRILKAYLILQIFFVCSIASATEPLHDLLEFGTMKGVLLPSKCCWVDLPATKRLREVRMAEFGQCSAVGGVVGRFKYEDGKIWLVGLYKCGGSIPLKEIYPEFESPTLATWLNGTFEAKFDWLCEDKNGYYVYKSVIKLVVDEGRVSSFSETKYDKSSCRD